ncbi:MAG TPA: hypothetical protein VLN49_05095 [Gemmatimonadaceae bacterium]|nr:hypothetical protein [Gemmatimonadaceae bacterium]
MRTLSQVRHVLAKDVRQQLWSLLAYAALVALATMHILAWPGMRRDIFEMLTVFVVMGGMVVVAQFVQADSPVRVDALWASRPLAPWAVLLEKFVAAALIVLALALIGQFIGLRTLDVPAGMMPGLLVESARQYGLWLLVAMVIAGLTVDLRSFVVALVALPIILLVVAETFFSNFDTGSAGSWVPIVLGAIAVCGSVALLARVYRTRTAPRAIWVGAFVIAGCAFASILGSRTGEAAVFEPAALLPHPSVTAAIAGLDQIASVRYMRLILDAADAPESTRFSVVSAELLVHLRDGREIHIPALPAGASSIGVHWSRPALGQGVTWIARTGAPTQRSEYAVPVDDAQRAAIGAGIASAELRGQMWVATSQVKGTFPLEIGARVAHNATRIDIEHWSHSGGDVALQLRMASIPRDQPPANVAVLIGAMSSQEFALLNERRHEAIALDQRGTSGGGTPMVLPGTNVEDRELSLGLATYPTETRPALDDDWFRSARLVQIDWVPRGSYRFRTNVSVP